MTSRAWKPAPVRQSSAAEHEADAFASDVMRNPARVSGERATIPSALHTASRAGGQPLEPSARDFMESRFGFDFSRVRIHADPASAASARAAGADAYTIGSDVVFDSGRYAPHTRPGRDLLAHELTHVLQQAASLDPILQRKVNAIRFRDEPTLKEISEGKKILKEKDHGEAVVRITTALHELGHYTIDIIDESFDPPLTSAVTRYQKAKALPKPVPGAVDKPTFDALDKDFSAGYGVERDVLSKQKAPDLEKHTQTLDDEERKAAARAISTEQHANPVTGLDPVFKPSLPKKGTYEDRLRTRVEKVILSEYDTYGKGKEAAHADTTKLYDWPVIDAIAVESQKAVDHVFGEYTKSKTPPPLKHGVNIKDAWDRKTDQLKAGGTAKEDSSAAWRVEKIVTEDEVVVLIDREHGAIQSRTAESKIVTTVSTALVKKYRKELIETHKGWPGFADKGKIYIQRFKAANPAENRWNMWDYYQTFIHEYIHTLEHPDHRAYRVPMGEQKGNKTLREGTADYFTKIVWNGIKIDDALRKTIEGVYYDSKDKFKVQELTTYGESANAERLAGIVGLRNLAAAFFLGKVELIGKK